MRRMHCHTKVRVHVKDLLEKYLCPSCRHHGKARCARSFVRCGEEYGGVASSPSACVEIEAYCNVLAGEEASGPQEGGGAGR